MFFRGEGKLTGPSRNTTCDLEGLQLNVFDELRKEVKELYVAVKKLFESDNHCHTSKENLCFRHEVRNNMKLLRDQVTKVLPSNAEYAE